MFLSYIFWECFDNLFFFCFWCFLWCFFVWFLFLFRRLVYLIIFECVLCFFLYGLESLILNWFFLSFMRRMLWWCRFLGRCSIMFFGRGYLCGWFRSFIELRNRLGLRSFLCGVLFLSWCLRYFWFIIL